MYLCAWLINLQLLWCVSLYRAQKNFVPLMFPCKFAYFDCVLRSPKTNEVGYLKKHMILIKSFLYNTKAASHVHDILKIFREVHKYTIRKLFMEIQASERRLNTG